MDHTINNSLATVFLFTLSVIKMGSLPASVCETVVIHKLSDLLLACSSGNSSGDDGDCALLFLTGDTTLVPSVCSFCSGQGSFCSGQV